MRTVKNLVVAADAPPPEPVALAPACDARLVGEHELAGSNQGADGLARPLLWLPLRGMKVESRHCHLRPPAVAADDVVHILHLRVVSEDLAPLHAPQQLCRREHRATTQLTHAPQRPGAT